MITIYCTHQGWMADFRHSADANRVHDLFGTYIIPTAFTATADAQDVLSTLRNGYGEEVTVRDVSIPATMTVKTV